jgi:glucose/arabinose dehydrogenase
VYYSAAAGVHRLVRYRDAGGIGVDETVLVDNLPSTTNHNGGNIGFGSDGKLYLSIGDNQDPANSQDENSRSGKILRFNPDGSIPADNPFGPGNPVFAMGLRNSFDFDFHPAFPNAMYASENGPNCDDEVNRIVAGGNYGWRPGYPCGDTSSSFTAPVVRINPVIAPTGVMFYSASRCSVSAMALRPSFLLRCWRSASTRPCWTLRRRPMGLSTSPAMWESSGSCRSKRVMHPPIAPWVRRSR